MSETKPSPMACAARRASIGFAAGLLSLGVASCALEAPTAFKMPNLPIKLASSGADDQPSAIPGWFGCAAIGGGAAYFAGLYAERDAKKQGLSKQEADKRKLGYMAGFGLLGCAVGKGVTDSIVRNMSAAAKAEREKAWAEAQSATGPVVWSDTSTGYSGTEEIIEVAESGGKECGVRRSVIKSAEGETEALQKQCRTAGGGKAFEPVTGLG